MKTYQSLLKAFVALAFLLLPFSSFAQADLNLLAGGERILNLRSDIQIEKDGEMLVKETIDVVSTNTNINHGIYRDFPTTYEDDYGNNHKVRFDVVSVIRDGAPDGYHLEKESNGTRVYIGKSDVTISPGVHTYELTYRTNRQLGFFEDHDELYWNATGNGWTFVIEKAEAHVKLPEGVDISKVNKVSAYTGSQGSKAEYFTTDMTNNSVNFYTTISLGQKEGMTVVVGWPKGIVDEPTQSQKVTNFIKDNAAYPVGLVLLLAVLGYYLRMWHKVGRDPEAQAIIPQYEAPRGLSPAQMRYLHKTSYDNKAMVAALINMGVKGYLTISEFKKEYTLKKIGKNEDLLSVEEKELADLFLSGKDEFEIKQENHENIMAANLRLPLTLFKMYGDRYFIKNWTALIKGVLLSALGIFIVAALGNDIVSGLYIVGIIVMAITFGFLLPRRTIEGRRLQDEIEGFKWFLSVTEKDRMNFHNPPEKTPELFEKFLAYALALGVENKWAEQFEDVFSKIKTTDGSGYHPAWFIGHSLSMGSLSGFASEMSSNMNSAIASSSVVPGSSSGMGGGGFSGGGVGGGGGGGW